MVNIAFFGTPPFTVDFLDMLASHDLAPQLIVTNPDRPVGRGMTLSAPAPKVWAQIHGITCLQPETIEESMLTTLAQTPWDLFIVVAYGKILPAALIDMPKFGTINVHYSLLPQYRGATPVESAILNGDESTGVSIQQMRYKLDSGPIIGARACPIEPTDTTVTLREKLNDIALVELPRIIADILAGTISPVEQDEPLATHVGKITKADGEIMLTDGGVFNDRKFRSHVGNVGTYFYTEKDGKRIRVKVISAHLDGDNFVIDEIVPENGKSQSYQQFLRQ